MIAKVCGHCRHWKHDRLCCRFPPVPVPPGPYLASVFPETTALMTCGEWSGLPDLGCSTITTYGPGGLATATTTDSAGGTFIERRVE